MKNNKTIKIQLIGIAVILIGGLLMLVGTQGTEEQSNVQIEKPVEQQVEETQPIEEKSNVTLAQKNCLGSALSYIRDGGFSKQSLQEQLEFEKYKQEDIKYAMENLQDVNWNEQCKMSCESYLRDSNFSREEMYSQLEHEGFLEEQINFALKSVGY